MSPNPESIRYDPLSGRMIVEFVNGAAFMAPGRLQGLDDATDADLSAVTLPGETGIHWERLDEDCGQPRKRREGWPVVQEVQLRVRPLFSPSTPGRAQPGMGHPRQDHT